MYYWLDTPTSSPYADNSTSFMIVHYKGYPSYYLASYTYAVVPCFSIRKQHKADCE